MNAIEIRSWSAEHGPAVVDLFQAAVHAIEPSIYSCAQQEAWAPTPPDRDAWYARLARTRPWLAFAGHTLVGFMEMDADGRIGCAYTHPDWQGRGVAGALLMRAELVANARGIACLSVDASAVARPFFERRGFVVVRQNTVKRSGQVLTNFSMEKWLRSKPLGPTQEAG